MPVVILWLAFTMAVAALWFWWNGAGQSASSSSSRLALAWPSPDQHGCTKDYVQAWWRRVQQEGRLRRWSSDTLVIATPHCRHVEWLELQYQALEKYSTHPFYLVVANDAPVDSQWHEPLRQFCLTHDRIWHLSIPPETRQHRDVLFPGTVQASLPHDAVSGRNSVAAQAAWAVVSRHRGYVALWDEDVVPFDTFDLGQLLKDKPALGIPQPRETLEYLWIAFFLADGRKLRDLHTLQWECGQYGGTVVDAGGWSAEWLSRHAQDVTRVDNAPKFHLDRHRAVAQELQGQRLLEKYLDCFLHYRGGSEWDGAESAAQSQTRRQRFFQAMHHRFTEAS